MKTIKLLSLISALMLGACAPEDTSQNSPFEVKDGDTTLVLMSEGTYNARPDCLNAAKTNALGLLVHHYTFSNNGTYTLYTNSTSS